MNRQCLQIDSLNLLAIAKDHIRCVRIVTAARKLIILQRVSLATTALVTLPNLITQLRTCSPLIASMLRTALQPIRLQEHVQRTRTHKTLRSVVAIMRALCIVIANLLVAPQSLIRSVLTIHLAIAQFIHADTKSRRFTHAIWMHTLVGFVVDGSPFHGRAIRLVRFVETIWITVTPQYARNTLDAARASKLIDRTVNCGVWQNRVASDMARCFVGRVNAVDEAVAELAEFDASTGLAVLFVTAAIVGAVGFVRIVTANRLIKDCIESLLTTNSMLGKVPAIVDAIALLFERHAHLVRTLELGTRRAIGWLIRSIRTIGMAVAEPTLRNAFVRCHTQKRTDGARLWMALFGTLVATVETVFDAIANR